MNMTSSTKALRPGPPNEQISSKILQPIYSALDSRNYAKAVKLTSPPGDGAAAAGSHREWDVVRALRIHALERSGRRRESLLLLWEVLASSRARGGDGRVWSELRSRIEALTEAADLVDADANANAAGGLRPQLQLLDAVQKLDLACFAADVDVLKEGEVDVDAGNAKEAKEPKEREKKQSKPAPAPAGKGKGKGKAASYTHTHASANKSKAKPATQTQQILPPITDQTVLQTLSATLRIEGLVDTLSEMYHQAVAEASAADAATRSVGAGDEFRNLLEEAACVHFEAACDCVPAREGDGARPRSRSLRELRTQRELTKYYERMQSACLRLAKRSGEPLHFQWAAVSGLWYRESLEDMVCLLDYFGGEVERDGDCSRGMKGRCWLVHILGVQDSDANGILEMCTAYKQKIELLPRLAESASYRAIRNKSKGDSPDGKQCAPSETDWDVYLETLSAQNKYEEMLEALRGIDCSPSVADGETSDDDVIPRIHDERTVENHVGTILPFTHRKKLERTAEIALKLKRFDEAEGCYRELLGVFPDQWTYWMGLMDSSRASNEPSDSGADREEGRKRCRAFAEEIVAAEDASRKRLALRGPRLFLVELAASEVRRSRSATDSKGGALARLREAICEYGDRFGPLASCCFADLRSYVDLLVEHSSVDGGRDDVAEDVSLVMKWAKGLWMIHSQSSDCNGAVDGGTSADELRERRKKLRTYIFSIQVCYGLVAALAKSNSSLDLMQNNTPSVNEMIAEWRTSLAFLPGVPPKDGGQKETLPGDEIALLISQHLHLKASCESDATRSASHLIAAAALLEEAVEHSPYNANLKIASIGVYSRLKAAHRAFEHYQDMGVKYIQLDSCSYLILPLLIRGGLYTQAIKLSSSLIKFHGSTSKDVKEYSTKSFRKGYLLKAKEMVTFQTEKMRPSVQLLQAKGVVMDCAALLNVSDFSGTKQKCDVRLGAEKGLCGSEEDAARAEQLVRDAAVHFNAPSILHASSNAPSAQNLPVSDNRDMTVNSFEILHRRQHQSASDMANESLLRGHTQGLLVRAVMVTQVAKAPKKGKVPKCTNDMSSRCKSLLAALKEANRFIDANGVELSEIDQSLWKASGALCEGIVAVIRGSACGNADDSLAEREKSAVLAVESSASLISKAALASSSADGDTVCQLLPDRIVPLFALVETTARLFALFGWGKRKAKAPAAALASLARLFKDFLSDALEIMTRFRAFVSSEHLVKYEEIEIGVDFLQKAIGHVVGSREMTTDRVDPFLLQMKEALQTFANEES